jgi:hypothetical protein
MAEEEIPVEVNEAIDDSLGEDAPTPKKRKREPVFRMIGDSKIPVSKAHGKVWKSRRAIAWSDTSSVREAWMEAIRYYTNDQQNHRNGQQGASGNMSGNQRLNDNITETENVVFSNVTTMVPALYARNPKAEFTSNIPDDEEARKFARMMEKLVNTIGARKTSPGINLKPKAKRCVVTTLLTNRSWLKIGWTFRQQSSEQALDDLAKLSKKLEKAKSVKVVEEVEGEIMALEEMIDILQPSGPFTKVLSPFKLMVDPNAEEIDLSDANWVIEQDFLPTQFLLAQFAKKKGNDQYMSIYKPSHVMKIGKGEDQGHDEDLDDTDIFQEIGNKGGYKSYGFEDEDSYNKAKQTKVYYVWDKVTRRVLLYNSSDWTWPIWVWDDPLQLDRFFPYYPLTFYESPEGPLTKGEVTYYLDQQDAINEITDEMRRARRWARRNVFFNTNLVDRADAEAVLNGDDGTARGLNIPDGMKLTEVIGTIPPPSVQFREMFDKESYYQAIDRISSVSEALRGAQFKTNTTNKAVQANVSASDLRVDEKSDQIEDWLGQVYWGIAQLCLINMDQETVGSLIGEELAAPWQNMQPDEIRSLSLTVVGGSTQKPTSKAKKEEAMEMGQVLGQFVQTSPMVLKIMLEVFQEAFDEVVITDEDWATIIESIAQQAQGQQEQAGPGGPEQGPPKAPGANGGIPDVTGAGPEQMQQIIQQLPPEMQQQVQQAIQAGMPPQQALQAAIQQVQGGTNPVPTVQ